MKDQNEKPIELDNINPEELDNVAGGVSVDNQEEEVDCNTYFCASFSEKLN